MLSSAVKHALRACRSLLSRMELPVSSESDSGSKRKLNEDQEVVEKRLKSDIVDDEEKVSVVSDDNNSHHNSNVQRKKPRQKKPMSVLKMNTLVRNKAVIFDENETSYYFENGFRKVHPYHFTFHTFCKERWLGKTLLEIYSKEFRYYPVSYYESARKAERLLLNMKPIPSLSVVVKENDMLTSTLHRHEGCVIESKIKILADDNKYLVVDKPSSIPMHPCGRYRNNSLIYILRKDYGYKDLLGCHRLDRLTSGIVIFAKTKDIATKITSEIRERQVEKEYVCEVAGEFPLTEESVVCTQPVTVFDRKIGISAAWEVDGFKSKDACTEFHRIRTNGKTSIVLCKPKTGRTHQIRVHLQYLGFPIINDPMYNNEAWGEDRFREGPCSKPALEVALDISRTYEFDPSRHVLSCETRIPEDFNQNSNETLGSSDPGLDAATDNTSPESNSSKNKTNLEVAKEAENTSDPHYSPGCSECNNPLPDPDMRWMVMHLHALRYKGTDWEFQTPLPEWAQPSDSGKEAAQTF